MTAGIDLALALVEEDLGPTVALAVARFLVVFMKRPGGQAQFSTALALQTANDKFGALHEWINTHLGDDLPLPVLADQAGMSKRSFCRQYAEATGPVPRQYSSGGELLGAPFIQMDETYLQVVRSEKASGSDHYMVVRGGALGRRVVLFNYLPISPGQNDQRHDAVTSSKMML